MQTSQSYSFSIDKKRNFSYSQLIKSCESGNSLAFGTVVALGTKLMQRAKLHAHFFADNSLASTAHYLASFAIGKTCQPADLLNLAQVTAIIALWEKRIAQRLPVEYITNQASYLGRKFYVNEHVLVPRSLMSAHFSDFLKTTTWQNYRVLDLCTGSGCIGITLALMHPDIKVDLVDISLEALKVAARNVHAHNLQERVTCLQSNLFENVCAPYDLIITNPPYVTTRDYAKVPGEFKVEPKLALEAGTDGLAIIAQILAQAPEYLTNDGRVIAEVGYPAAKLIKQRYKHLALSWLGYKKPSVRQTWFDKWITPLVNMDCTLILEK
jgi:ribosomal protein L3-specific protein-(glutamine-N5) methyltransferase